LVQHRGSLWLYLWEVLPLLGACYVDP
jgi:hypothetical protein